MARIWTAIGLMSGTSMDGIDAALVRTDGKNLVERGPMQFFAYDPATRDLLEGALETAKSITDRKQRPGNLKQIEALITKLHGNAVLEFLAQIDIRAREIDLLGFHGQTVLHRPEMGLTVQLGDGKALAGQAGIDVVYDFRAEDMRNGGQGAPLVPVYHRALSAMLPEKFRQLSPVAFVNIGGISNITYVGEGGEICGFDTGPGNALIDQWVQQHAGIPFDEGGMIAREGVVIETLVDRYLKHPYFEQTIPKSLDRFDFQVPDPSDAGLEDGARSLAKISAEAIFKACDHLEKPPELWIMCGGGRLNPSIMKDLHELAQDCGALVASAEEAGFDGDAMEAEAFGYLAVRSVQNLSLTYPKTTGCNKPSVGGELQSTVVSR